MVDDVDACSPARWLAVCGSLVAAGVGVNERWRIELGSGSSRLENGVELLAYRPPPALAGIGIRLGVLGLSLAYPLASDQLLNAGLARPGSLTLLARLIRLALRTPIALARPPPPAVALSRRTSFSSRLVEMFQRGFGCPAVLPSWDGAGLGARREERGGGVSVAPAVPVPVTERVERCPNDGGGAREGVECDGGGTACIASDDAERFSDRGGRGGERGVVVRDEGGSAGRGIVERVGVDAGEDVAEAESDGWDERLDVILFARRRNEIGRAHV